MARTGRGGARHGAGRPKGGRSQTTIQAKARLSDLAKKHTSTALKTLVDVATNGVSESARVTAANALLDRAYGRPTQSHEHSGPHGGPIPTVDLTNLTDDQLATLEGIFGPLALTGDDDDGDQAGEGEA